MACAAASRMRSAMSPPACAAAIPPVTCADAEDPAERVVPDPLHYHAGAGGDEGDRTAVAGVPQRDRAARGELPDAALPAGDEQHELAVAKLDQVVEQDHPPGRAAG